MGWEDCFHGRILKAVVYLKVIHRQGKTKVININFFSSPRGLGECPVSASEYPSLLSTNL
jgi:hypothetical protein